MESSVPGLIAADHQTCPEGRTIATVHIFAPQRLSMASIDDVSHKQAQLECCPPGHNGRDVALTELADALHDRYPEEGKIDDVDKAIELHREALELRPPGHLDRDSSLHSLALCLWDRYDDQGVVADLDEAIMLGRATLDLCLPGHPDRGVSLYNLGCYVQDGFRKLVATCDLDEAIELHRAALELRPPGHPDRYSSFHSLVLCLSDRYANQGVVADLDEAIELLHAALELDPPGRPDRDSLLRSLARCLLDRYANQGVVVDLDEAVTLGRAALELRPPEHIKRGISLYNLGRRLWQRFQKLAVRYDLSEAIGLLRAALELCPPGHPHRDISLHALAICLSSRYDDQGVVADLEEAVMLGRATLDLCPPGHPYRDVSLHSLGCYLRGRFRKLAAMCDLDEAIELHRAALELRPPGHPNRGSSFRSLAHCLSDSYANQGGVADLEEAITLSRAALELFPLGHPKRDLSLSNLTRNLWRRFQSPMPGKAKFLRRATFVLHPTRHADVASSLHTLSMHFWNRFQKQATIADLDEAICLVTYVLELQLPGHPNYVVFLEKFTLFIGERVTTGRNLGESVMLARAVDNLCALGRYLKDRFRDQDSIANLNAAIKLHRYVLQLRPNVHPNYASNLDDLALCLIDRFRQTGTVADLDDAIALEQNALQLSVAGDPGYDIRKDSLANFLRMKISPQASRVTSIQSVAREYEVSQVIRNVISEILETMPTRLLNTHTGTLCNRAAQLSHFVSSQQYNKLLSSATSYDLAQPIDHIHIVVSAYFRFVMFSHHWGEDEPSLRDTQGYPVYDMPQRGGVKKLQKFCTSAFKLGYLWAWSDTCCIDKDSSAELQEAIGAMFGWYRRSALTIVYLADVRESGSFAASQWFRRGWTLQELLASRTVLFYTRNWSLYKNLESSNHKTDGAVLEELEGSTGIASRFLTNFSPGMDDARLGLQWASSRRTTRPEDIAYSLFGIFNLNLTVRYGESAENALGRLLAEIISRSGDITILDWVGEASPFHSCFPACINSYQTLSLPSHPPEEQSSTGTQQPVPSRALQKFYGSLAKLSLSRFINHRLILPCLSYRVKVARLKSANASSPTYTYEIQASGLRPPEITLSKELENATMVPDALQLVRPWHSKSLGGFTKPDTPIAEQLLVTLGRPFNALLLTKLPHNEYKRIAPSILITARPVDSVSILQNKVGTFYIVLMVTVSRYQMCSSTS